MTRTNIKNLPEGEYMTECGYSQLYPWKVIKRTPKTATLCRVNTASDPEWKDNMIWHVGGFTGHCENQTEQTWLYDGVGEQETVVVRQGKGQRWAHKGRKFVSDRATEFYDYNF